MQRLKANGRRTVGGASLTTTSTTIGSGRARSSLTAVVLHVA